MYVQSDIKSLCTDSVEINSEFLASCLDPFSHATVSRGGKLDPFFGSGSKERQDRGLRPVPVYPDFIEANNDDSRDGRRVT